MFGATATGFAMRSQVRNKLSSAAAPAFARLGYLGRSSPLTRIGMAWRGARQSTTIRVRRIVVVLDVLFRYTGCDVIYCIFGLLCRNVCYENTDLTSAVISENRQHV